MSQVRSNQMSHEPTNVNIITRLFNGCLSRLFQISTTYKFYINLNLSQVLLLVSLISILPETVTTSHVRYSSNSGDSNLNSIRKNCSKCSLLLEDAKIRRLEEFKREFLHKLGFKEAPKVTVNKSLYNIPPLDSLFIHKNSKQQQQQQQQQHQHQQQQQHQQAYFDSDIMLGDDPLVKVERDNGHHHGRQDDSENEWEDSAGSIKKFISFAKLRE